MAKNSKSIDDQIAEFKELFGPPPVPSIESKEAYFAAEDYFATMAGSLKGIPPFKAALIAYAQRPRLTTAEGAHLQRWAEDDRAEEVWQAIERAAQENNKLLLSAACFICQILAIKRVARAMDHLRKDRVRIRKHAEEMERKAKFLLMPDPLGMPPIFPRSGELARLLRDAAAAFRGAVAPTQYVPGVGKTSRESDAPAIFMSQVGHYLKETTGQWLDNQVAVLTEIAFEDLGLVDAEQTQRARRNVRRRSAARKPAA